MTIDLTKILLAIITLVGTVISGFVIPWLKNKLTDHQYDTLAALVRVGVFAAAQIFTMAGLFSIAAMNALTRPVAVRPDTKTPAAMMMPMIEP